MTNDHYPKMSNFCSVLCLCVAAVSCVLSIALMAIAISTDNWQQVSGRNSSCRNFQLRNITVVVVNWPSSYIRNLKVLCSNPVLSKNEWTVLNRKVEWNVRIKMSPIDLGINLDRLKRLIIFSPIITIPRQLFSKGFEVVSASIADMSVGKTSLCQFLLTCLNDIFCLSSWAAANSV